MDQAMYRSVCMLCTWFSANHRPTGKVLFQLIHWRESSKPKVELLSIPSHWVVFNWIFGPEKRKNILSCIMALYIDEFCVHMSTKDQWLSDQKQCLSGRMVGMLRICLSPTKLHYVSYMAPMLVIKVNKIAIITSLIYTNHWLHAK